MQGGVGQPHDVVAEEHRERLVAHERLGAQDGVAESERLLLPHVGHLRHVRDGLDLRELLELAAVAAGSTPARRRRRSGPRWRACSAPVTMMICSSPESTASSTTYWMVGLSTSGSISLGWAFVAGRKRVPRPAAGNTALRTLMRPTPFGCLHLGGPRKPRRRGDQAHFHGSAGGPDAMRGEGLLHAPASLELERGLLDRDDARVETQDRLGQPLCPNLRMPSAVGSSRTIAGCAAARAWPASPSTRSARSTSSS